MNRRGKFLAAMLTCTLASRPTWADEPQVPDREAVHAIAREVEFAGILNELSARGVHGPTIFRDVSVVDVVHARTTAHQTVVTRNSKIDWVGDSASAPSVRGALVVDGRGLFLSPGLTDMHVHTRSLAEQVLRLATGNTSVREMDGFPWMLRLRRATQAGHLSAPTAYIAGTIIADQPLSGYAVVVKTEADARQQVRNQAACGYDFIKVHNSLSQPLFDAVADQARRSGKDLVGHVPHNISVDHAVHAGGMRTLEHLKGFINDGDLQVSNEDYAAALKGAQVWLTPTFYVLRRFDLHDEAARRELARPEMRYVPVAIRNGWRATAHVQPDWHDRLAALLPAAIANSLPLYSPLILQKHMDESVPKAMARLLPLRPHWLAGTDAAQYEYQVAGYALLEELVLMEQHGIARADVLRAATSEPAAAMRHGNEFGQVMPGMRADLILLAADPATDVSVFRVNRGVMAAGVWLDRSALDAALGELARIQAEPEATFVPNAKAADALAAQVLELSVKDVALDPMLLTPAAAAMHQLGYASAAEKLMAADTDSAPGPCREDLPGNED